MDILLKILQFVVIYLAIGLIFAVGIVCIYEKDCKGRDNYDSMMAFINNPRILVPLLLVIGVAWPRFLVVFVVEFIKGVVKYIPECYHNWKGDADER